jgi:hypothetical protein
MDTIIAFAVFASVFSAALLGMGIKNKIPQHHLESDAKDVIRLVTGITATMSALVLGMLVSSAKIYYDSWNIQVAEIASQVVTIDHLLTSYGFETGEIRTQFRRHVEDGVTRAWHNKDPLDIALRPKEGGDTLIEQVELLTPKSALQTAVKAQLTPQITALRMAQWRMFLRTRQNSMPVSLLLIVISWQCAIFISMGLFAPSNTTVYFAFALGALTVSTAIFIILEMYSPFKGILTISSAPITDALTQMAH